MTELVFSHLYLTFDHWEETFRDTMLTGAIVDRLTYKSHILDMSREKWDADKNLDLEIHLGLIA